jgi:hypothetical protein
LPLRFLSRPRRLRSDRGSNSKLLQVDDALGPFIEEGSR